MKGQLSVFEYLCGTKMCIGTTYNCDERMAVAWRKICEHRREDAVNEVNDAPNDLRVDLGVNLWMIGTVSVVESRRERSLVRSVLQICERIRLEGGECG